jgi:hypothetical protein
VKRGNNFVIRLITSFSSAQSNAEAKRRKIRASLQFEKRTIKGEKRRVNLASRLPPVMGEIRGGPYTDIRVGVVCKVEVHLDRGIV